MPVVFTPYLQKAKERLPPIASPDRETEPADPLKRRLAVGATVTAIAGVVGLAVARRLRIRRRDDTATGTSNSDT